MSALRIRLNVAACFASIALLACAACGGHASGEAKGPESDPWAGYKGTYATSAGASGSPSARVKAAQAAAPKEEATPAAVAEETPAAAPEPAPAAASAPKAKKAKAAPVTKAAAPKKKK